LFAAERAVVIGLDAPIVKSILKYSREGKLPNITRLIENGVWAENCLLLSAGIFKSRLQGRIYLGSS